MKIFILSIIAVIFTKYSLNNIAHEEKMTMSYTENFKTLLGETLPTGYKAYALELSESENNPFLIMSRHTGKDGGTMAIKSRILYVRSKEFNHPNAQLLSL